MSGRSGDLDADTSADLSAPHRLIVAVTGPPSAGKSTLAVPLAHALGLPLLAKDTVKEALFDELGSSDHDASRSRALSDAAYRVIASLLERFPAAVIDMNLPPEWVPTFTALAARPLQVFCRCPQAELERRLVARATARHPVHNDDVVLDEVRTQGVRGAEPAGLNGPLLEVDTSTPVDIAGVVSWVEREAYRRA